MGVYGYLLRESVPVWIFGWVDGVLLVDLWGELDLSEHLRAGWQPLIDDARDRPVEDPIKVSSDDNQKSKREERQERTAARRAAAARRLAESD